jgi:hypothetical protein
LFGGRTTFDFYSDLWKYNSGTNEWTWVKGDNTFNSAGVYGIKGTPSPTNKPGARNASIGWTTSTALWLFGGNKYVSGSSGESNDLWSFALPVPAPVISSFAPSIAAEGDTVTITGTNLTGATAVTFGGTAAASFTIVNSTTISAQVGIGASGSISVTTPGGTTAAAGFTYCQSGLWTGNVSGDWYNAGNWSCKKAPLPGANIIIPATSNQPFITAATTIGNLTLEGAFNLNNQGLVINGSVSGNGSFTGSSTSSLTINGNAGKINFTTGVAILKALNINAGANAIIDANLIIAGQ